MLALVNNSPGNHAAAQSLYFTQHSIMSASRLCSCFSIAASGACLLLSQNLAILAIEHLHPALTSRTAARYSPRLRNIARNSSLHVRSNRRRLQIFKEAMGIAALWGSRLEVLAPLLGKLWRVGVLPTQETALPRSCFLPPPPPRLSRVSCLL